MLTEAASSYHSRGGAHWNRCRAWVLWGLLLTLAGCGYPTISRDAYDIAKALHAVATQKDAASLPKAEQVIEQARTDGKITASEYAIFADRLAEARDGEWETMATELHKMLADQNVRAR